MFAMSLAGARPASAQPLAGRFDTNEKIGGNVARARYTEVLTNVSRLAGTQEVERCDFRGHSQPCFRIGEGGAVFAPPFAAAIGATARASLKDEYLDLLLQRDSPLVEQVGWAPAAQVRNANVLLSDYERRARSHDLFGCSGNECITIVELLANDGTSPKRVLGACRVSRINGRAGPPEYCEGIVVQTQDEVWLKAAVADVAEGGQGQPDFAFNAIGPPNASFGAMRDAIRQAMTTPPLSLSVQAAPFGFLGVGDRRTSVIDQYFREMLTVRIDWVEADIFSRELGRLRLAKAMVSTTIYVNRLNTSDADDWHLPSAEQQQAYQRLLTAAVKSAVMSRCAQPTWIDSFTVACGLNVPPGTRITLP